ncbi:MAG: hypothetical protein ACFFD4_19360 [Candidatus Odinarchaeota archaeon]
MTDNNRTDSFSNELKASRDVGLIHFHLVNHNTSLKKRGELINRYLREWNLTKRGKLLGIDRGEAKNVLIRILTHDLAHDYEIMSEDEALNLVNRFLQFFKNDARFFTNAEFTSTPDKPVKLVISSWNPLTSATFDTGVFAIDCKKIGLILVEDED